DPDDTVTVSCTPASGTTFPQGTTSVTCSGSDTHGNTTTAVFNVHVNDTTPPETFISNAPTGHVRIGDATILFTSEPSVTFDCQIDDGNYAPCSSPVTLDGLGDG